MPRVRPCGCKRVRQMQPRAPRYTLADFDYALPPALIAQAPAAERAGSRLLHVSRATFTDHRFVELPRLLARGDLIVFNDTRVVRARINALRPTGAATWQLRTQVTFIF